MAAKKLTTGLAGLKVAQNPQYTLSVLYNKTLKVLEKMPKDAAYRNYMEALVTERQNIVETEKDPAVIQARIGSGQVEELIIQADNELLLARKILEWRAWEPLMQDPPKGQWKWPI